MGSVPFESAAEVFTTSAQALPDRLSGIPDGETGNRGNFIRWQLSTLPTAIRQQRVGGPPQENVSKTFDYNFPDFKPTGYDDIAIQSFAIFKELQANGTIPSNVRFQVALPSPATVIRMYVVTEHCAQAETLYEKRLFEALRRIQNDIPAQQLVIQWDVPTEIGMLEYEAGRTREPFLAPYFKPVEAGILERWKRLASVVDADVEMGFHICYGDSGHEHFVQPEDMRLMVDLAKDIVRNVAPVHPVKYIHMPVLKGWTDARFFESLADLNLDGAKLFLGLVHSGDIEGTRKRIAAAQSVYGDVFGVATECGLGRTPPEEVSSILRILKTVTASGK